MAGSGLNRACILLFVKSPAHGPVKSRLAQTVGAEMATALYRNFVLDMLATLSDVIAAGRSALRVCFFPPAAGGEIRDWLGNAYALMPQEGNDLGGRMKNAFLTCFAAGYRRVIVLGSDTPDLTSDAIAEGLDCLNRYGAVIGPARDGGYYLLGFQAEAFSAAIFSGMPWSTSQVFDLTMEAFRRVETDVCILPPWRDIDTFADLQALREGSSKGRFSRSRTGRYLHSHFRGMTENCK